MKYQNLKPTIEKYFSECLHESCTEPLHGLAFSPYSEKHGPDIMRLTLVAEIKDEEELERDLSSHYWSSWNSPTQSFGGKKKGYKLQDDLPSPIPGDGNVRGWIATVFGQLRYYSLSANIADGWLIIENYDHHKTTLLEALHFLTNGERIKGYTLDQRDGIGFVRIFF